MESQGTVDAAEERELYQAGLYLDGSGCKLVSTGCRSKQVATREASAVRSADLDFADGYSCSSDSECESLYMEFQHIFPEFESFETRMETFRNVSTNNVDAEDLAAAGFYSKGDHDGDDDNGDDDTSNGREENDYDDECDEGDEGEILQCWSCSLEMGTGELTCSSKLQYPFLVHQQRAPHCPFLTSLASGPAFELLGDAGDALPDPHENDSAMGSEGERRLTYGGAALAPAAAAAWSRSGFYFTGVGSVVRCACCGLAVAATACRDEPAIVREHRYRSPFCKLLSALRRQQQQRRSTEQDEPPPESGLHCESVRGADQDEPAESGLHCESVRFATFGAWPQHAAPACAGELAAAGFHYAGVGTSVTCFACDVTVRHFPAGRSAVDAHGAQVPRCPLLVGGGNGDDGDAPGAPPANVPLRVPAVGKPERLRELGVRLATFGAWPGAAVVPVGGEQLADAGLFYLNVGDVVRCAFCHVELRHWRRGETAWGRHRDAWGGRRGAAEACEHVRDHCPDNVAAYIAAFFTPHRGMPTSAEVEEIGLPRRSHETKPFIPPTPAPPRSQPRRQAPQHEPMAAAAPWPRRMPHPPRNPVPASPVRTVRPPGPGGPVAPGYPAGVRMPVPAPAAMQARRRQPRQPMAAPPRPANVCIGCAGSVSHFLMPCSHLSCSQCARLLAFCPASGCEQPVSSTVRILTF